MLRILQMNVSVILNSLRPDETTVTREEHRETMKTSRYTVIFFFSSGCLQKEVQRDRSNLGKRKQNKAILVHCGFSLF